MSELVRGADGKWLPVMLEPEAPARFFAAGPTVRADRPHVMLGEFTGKRVPRLEAIGWGRCWMGGRTVQAYNGEPWFLDNGAFRTFRAGTAPDFTTFNANLHKLGERLASGELSPPSFAVLPDVVGNRTETLENVVAFLEDELPTYESLGFVAPWFFPVQDGMTPADLERTLVNGRPLWTQVAGIFLGGSAAWKSATAPMWAAWAEAHGMPWHYARCGTPTKLAQAFALGATSLDSAFPMWTDERWSRFERLFTAGPEEGPPAQADLFAA